MLLPPEPLYYTRMAQGIYKLLRTPPLPDPERAVREQLENRETIVLETVRRVIFGNPDHPYQRMFRMAGCSYEDLSELVKREGLETALAAIHKAGVYLTHDEFKGKTPIIRSGRHIPANENSFVNPLVKGLVGSASSGSRSMGTRTRQSTEYRLYVEAQEILTIRELGLAERAHVQLKPILPSTGGLSLCLTATRHGGPVEQWFAMGGNLLNSWHYRAATNFLVILGNLLGARAPFPTYLPLNEFSPVADWIARRRSEGRPCRVNSFTSPAVRVAAAAMQKGLDIRGTLFLVGGEPLTDAKRSAIEATGAEVFNNYAITELGPIGQSCRQMRSGNCVHLFRDSVAVISHRRRAPLADVEVNSLLFTTLLPFASNVFINAEMDDSGVIERTRCDCTFTRAGFTEQIRDVFSFGKLTGQGMTLVGTDVVRILEEALPARIGGGPGDYQLVEREGAFQTQIYLRISPRVRLTSTNRAKEYFLKEVRRCYGGTLAARNWRHAEAMEVVIAEPFATLTGKVLPLHLLGAGGKPNSDAQAG